jgi:arylsulfatase A-like enzyme
VEFLGWEREHGQRPFFAFLNFYDAHLPYDPPGDWSRRFATKPNDLDRYDGAIAYMDQEVGLILAELQRRGILDHTIVVITSDHGEGFGEHGLYGHGNSLYRPELHVPLVIRYPGHVPANQRVASAVSLRDLGATLFDLTGLKISSSIGGSSLAGSWTGATSSQSAVVAEVSAGINTEPNAPVSRGAMRSLIDSATHYIRNGDGVEELYSYRDDPGELRDISGKDSVRVASLRAAANQAVGRAPVKR